MVIVAPISLNRFTAAACKASCRTLLQQLSEGLYVNARVIKMTPSLSHMIALRRIY
eukprot:COSAG05_NODE_1299_length_5244_cov_93.435180_5_plen_56_part_00